MTRRIDLPPSAPALMESMRAVGYSLESAIADLVDNSISAGATDISVRYSPYGEPYVAVLDNGSGMSERELIAAMKHGSDGPQALRADSDLGRFGLGLKTASLSQCRQLTVVTKHSGTLSAARWDLDTVAETRGWTLELLSQREMSALPHLDYLSKQVASGTVVLWRNLDRMEIAAESLELALGQGMDRTRDHLALVFHRFIAPENPRAKKLLLSLNESPLEPVDPFLQHHPSTHRLPEETVRISEALVRVQPFVLPHFSKLTTEEMRHAGGEHGLRRWQGFYVYRAKRLIVWGSWFRMSPHYELTKLARVRVDIPNSLDHLWALDIKKSKAVPPAEVTVNLKRVIERIGDGSRRVYTYRGRRLHSPATHPIWDRVQVRTGIDYRVNREHPVFQSLREQVPDEAFPLLLSFLQQLEACLPYDAVYADMAANPKLLVREDVLTEEDLEDLAGRLLDALPNQAARTQMASRLHQIEPFSKAQDLTRRIIQRLL